MQAANLRSFHSMSYQQLVFLFPIAIPGLVSGMRMPFPIEDEPGSIEDE
jgi:hypothetical protein